MLLKAKQLDIKTVIQGMTQYFVANPTDRDTFVQDLALSQYFDVKVKASSTDTNPGFLIDKIEPGTTDPSVTLTITYDATTQKVKLDPKLDKTNLTETIFLSLGKIIFTADEVITEYLDNNLSQKHILWVFREGRLLYQGSNPDEYTFDATLATITFNTQVEVNERLQIYYF